MRGRTDGTSSNQSSATSLRRGKGGRAPTTGAEREEGGDVREEGNKVNEHRQDGHGKTGVEILEEQFCMSACARSVHAQDTQHYSAENS